MALLSTEAEVLSKATETTRTVKIADFVQEHPPAVLLSETVPGPSGRLRVFTQKVQVPDADLWDKLTAEVRKGGSITATVKTIWPDSGPYYSCLDGFVSVDASRFALAAATA